MIDVSKLPLGERGCKNCKHTRLFCSACVRLGTEEVARPAPGEIVTASGQRERLAREVDAVGRGVVR